MAKSPDILRRARAAPLFLHVGEPIEDKGVKPVADWPACAAGIASNKWVNIGTMIFNRIFAVADRTHDSAWMGENWNAMVATRSAEIAAVVGPAAKPLVKKHKLGKRFEWTVTGHLLQAWLLAEYPDAPAAAWNDRVVGWYLAGHVPCGYSGAVPAGKSSDATKLPDPAKGKLLVF